jgi:hypothetical protein
MNSGTLLAFYPSSRNALDDGTIAKTMLHPMRTARKDPPRIGDDLPLEVHMGDR